MWILSRYASTTSIKTFVRYCSFVFFIIQKNVFNDMFWLSFTIAFPSKKSKLLKECLSMKQQLFRIHFINNFLGICNIILVIEVLWVLEFSPSSHWLKVTMQNLLNTNLVFGYHKCFFDIVHLIKCWFENKRI